MHILWASNYSSQSGYANQARLFVPAIHSSGHRVTVFELSNGTRLPQEIGGIKIIPGALDPLGSDIMQAHVQRVNAHCVITLIDAWGMKPEIMRGLNWYPWTPVDTTPVAPHVVTALEAARRPIAMSQFGVTQLKAVGVDPFYMPHALDTSVWYPREWETSRRTISIDPDVFFVSFVGVNDSNPSRKGIPELLMAWKLFSDSHTDAVLYLHTSKTGNLAVNGTGGVRIENMIRTFDIRPDSIRFVDEYRYRTGIPASELATIASASDVLVLPTRGEGFGLPLIEFQRCGCPVITTDVATGPELCFSGWLIEGEPEWNWQDAIVKKPGVVALVEAIEAAYDDRGNPARRAKAIEGARAYDLEHVLPTYTLPVLEQIAEMSLANVA